MAEPEFDSAGPRSLASSGKPRRRGVSVVLTLVFVAVLAAGAVYLVHRARQPAAATAGGGFGRAGGRPPSGNRPGGAGGALNVTVGEATAKEGSLPIMIDALGTITPPETATLVPQVSGVLTEVMFTEGQMVKKGQVLARIDQRPYQQALAQAQGTRAKDEAQLAAAQITLQRYRVLLGQDSIARQDFDTQDATVKQLQGAVETDKAAEQVARINLGFTTITAPFTGLIGLRTVDPGNYVSTGTSGGIATLTQIQPIDVVFTVPQDQIPDVRAAASSGHLPVTALDRARVTQLATGRFLTLDNQVNISTGTVRAKARFDNADGKLFPNQFVNVRLQLGTSHGVLVPVTAVRTGPNGDYVYVIDQDSTAHMRPVKRGLANADQILITQGLQAGEQIVSEGGDRVKDGSPVRRVNAAPASGPSSGASGAGGRHSRQNNLSPQDRAKLQGMTPEQRHAYFQQLRQQRGADAASSAAPAASAQRGQAAAQP